MMRATIFPWRQGSVASMFPVPFEGKSYFLVDAILHNGTSGSPVVTQPANVYRTKGGTLAIGPQEKLYLGRSVV